MTSQKLIEDLIERCKMRPAQIAAAVGAAQWTVTRWHKGATEPLPVYRGALENLHAKQMAKLAKSK